MAQLAFPPPASTSENASFTAITVNGLKLSVFFKQPPEIVEGQDGRKIVCPAGWQRSSGKDGRMVAFPPHWQSSQGADGRLVAFPSGWIVSTGSDGRSVPHPMSWTFSSGSDGRAVARPFDWTFSSGSDGRAVACLFGAQTEEGRDGRKLVKPSNGKCEMLFSDAETPELVKMLTNQIEATEISNLFLYFCLNQSEK